MTHPTVERIRREEYTQSELLRMFTEAAEEAKNHMGLSEAWFHFADNLHGSYRERAREVYATNLKRVGVAVE